MEDPLLDAEDNGAQQRKEPYRPSCCKRHRGSQWGGWAVAAAFYLFDVFLRLTVNVVTSKLQEEFNLTAAAVSAAFSSSFFYAYAAGQIPVGFALDVLGPRATIALASLLSAAGCVLFSCAETETVGMVARIISGFGCGCGWLGAVKVTRNSFGTDEESELVRGVFAVTCMLGGLGGLISQAPFQSLTSSVGWRSAFRIAAVIPVIIALCAVMLVGDVAFCADEGEKEEEREQKLVHCDDRASTRTVLYNVITSPFLWMLALYLGGTDAPFETFAGLWGVPFLTQALAFSSSSASRLTTIVVAVGTASQLLAGPLMGYFRSERSKVLTLCGLALLGVIVFVSFILVPYFPVVSRAPATLREDGRR